MSLYLDPENIEEVENEVQLLIKKYGSDEVLGVLNDYRDDRIKRALKVLRMPYEPENEEDYGRKMASYYSQAICVATDILEGKD
jgi:hypothetical protein